MLGTQLQAIWNDETVYETNNIEYKNTNSFIFVFKGYRTIEKRRSQMDQKVPVEKFPRSIWFV